MNRLFSLILVSALCVLPACTQEKRDSPVVQNEPAPVVNPKPECAPEPAKTPEPVETPEKDVPTGTFAELQERPLYTFNEADVDLYLQNLRDIEPDLHQRIVHLGRKNLGQPYELYLLGEFPYEIYDPQPLYCLDRSDCVVFSEHTFAMALGYDWPSFFWNLQRIRYRDGKIGVLTRNHYTIADWDVNNAWLFEDMTQKLADGKACVPLHQVCRRQKFFRDRYKIETDIPDQVVTDAYIPVDNVPMVLDELQDGDFVHIIRGNDKSQYAGHVGLIVHDENGTVDFLHSTRPRVKEQPLMEYLRASNKSLGIKILRLHDNAQEIIDEQRQ